MSPEGQLADTHNFAGMGVRWQRIAERIIACLRGLGC